MKKLISMVLVFLMVMSSFSVLSVFAASIDDSVSADSTSEYAMSMPFYLDDQEARCFLGFLFNTNELTEERLQQGNFYALLTGQLSDESEIQSAFAFLDFMDAQLSRTIDKFEYGNNVSKERMLDYLYLKAEESPNLAQEIVSETLYSITDSAMDYILDEYTIHGGPLQDMEYEYIQNGQLVKGIYDQISNIPEKVDEYKKMILALSGSAFYAGGTNRQEMYNYFLFAKDNMVYKYEYSQEIYETVMAQKELDENYMTIRALQPILANWPFFDENMLLWGTDERIALIEKWAEFTYFLEELTTDFSISTNPDFIYTVVNESSIKITGYTGKSEVIIIPDKIDGLNVVSIAKGAFDNCTNLASIYIGKNVKYIEELAFNNCGNLININVSEYNENFSSQDGVLFNKDFSKIIYYPKNKIETEYLFPDSVVDISDYAFYNCKNIIKITGGDNISTIGNYAFYGCTGLSCLDFLQNVKTIGNYAFYNCTNISNLELSEGLKTIGCYSFSNCVNISKISFPNSIIEIGNGAFRSCNGLSDVYYAGKENEWYQINIGEYNQCLLKCNIYCEDITIFSPVVTDNGKVFFNNTFNWSQVYCYMWTESGGDGFQNSSWPGVIMTNEGNGIWSSKLSSNFDYIIFTNGNEQSVDLVIPGAGYIATPLELNYRFNVSWEIYTEPSKIIMGDVNNDGIVDIKDATVIQKYTALIPVEINTKVADVDKDGRITIKDTTLIQKYASKIIDNF